MAGNQQNQQFNTDELGGKFGEALSRAFVRVIALEKRCDILLANEAAMLAQVANLDAEIARLRQSAPHPSLSPTSVAIAAEGRAVIANDGAGEIEKADP